MPEEFLHVHGTEIVSTYDTQFAAQHAVNVLAASDFEITGLSIVGHGVTLVERVQARLSYGRVALTGAFSGVYFGVGISLIALMLGMLGRENIMNNLLACMLIGVGLGVLFAVVNFAFNRRRRKYIGLGGLKAVRYDLHAPRNQVLRARQILAEHARKEH